MTTSARTHIGRRFRVGRTTLHSLALMLLIGLLVGTGTGVTYALWVASATGNGSASGAQLTVTSNFADANTIFTNDNLGSTGSFTIANTTVTSSTTAGTYAVTLASTGDAALRSGLSIAVWPTTTPAGCPAITTVPGGALTGTWASFTAPITGTVAAGASKSYCLRMSATERTTLATATGQLLITPTVSATLTVGTWGASSSASTTQKTAFVFPSYAPTPSTWFQLLNQSTGRCLDVYSAGAANDTALIDYACKTGNETADYNQEWLFTPTTGGYYTITPRHAQTLRVDIEGASGANLAAANVHNNTAARQSQEWLVQVTPSGAYQFVNRLSGRCLQPNDTAIYAAEIEVAQATCDGSTAQRYTLATKETIVPTVSLTCAAVTGGGISLSWSGAAIDAYNFFAKLGAGGFAAVGSVAAGATTITILPSAIATADGNYTAQARWGTYVLDDVAFYKKTVSGTSTLSCIQPLGALMCSESGARNISLSWGFPATAAYQVQWLNGAVWTLAATATTGSTSQGVTASNTYPNGAVSFRVANGADVSSTVVATKGTTGFFQQATLDCP